jgi:hypothetical protein
MANSGSTRLTARTLLARFCGRDQSRGRDRHPSGFHVAFMAANTRKRRLIRAYFGEGKACRVEVFDTVGGRCIYLVLCRVMSPLLVRRKIQEVPIK